MLAAARNHGSGLLPSEIELKLELTASGAEALRASRLFGEDGSGIALQAAYFDTPDHGLHRKGLLLRIRETGGMPIQTVKSYHVTAGFFDREEWELPVTGKHPVADERTPIPQLLGPRFGELAPVFEVSVLRNSCRFRNGDESARDCVSTAWGARPPAELTSFAAAAALRQWTCGTRPASAPTVGADAIGTVGDAGSRRADSPRRDRAGNTSGMLPP